MGSLDGISSSTPPNGLNRSCIAVPSFLVGTTSSSRAVCRMARASCSMERPFSAARMHSRLCKSSSRLRIVRLVTTKPSNSIAREYCMIKQQSLWLPGLNIERPGVFKPVVPAPIPRFSRPFGEAGLTAGSVWRKPAGTVWMAWLPALGIPMQCGSPSSKTWFSALHCCIMIQRYCYGPTLLVVGNGSHTIQVQENTSDEHS